MHHEIKLAATIAEVQIIIDALKTELGFARFNAVAVAANGSERAEAARRAMTIEKMLTSMGAEVPPKPGRDVLRAGAN